MQLLFSQMTKNEAEFLAKTFENWPYLALAVCVVVVILLLRRYLRRRKKIKTTLPAEPTIDVAQLYRDGHLHGPPASGPTLEFYNIPVRLVAVAIAPVGRLHKPPHREQLPEIIDCILPGLDHVNDSHRSAVFIWPRQLSVRGFAHSFFTHVELPDQHETKNPWSLVAGLFKVDDQPMMAGLVLQADNPNRHGQYIMEKEEDWLGILRIRQ